MATRKISKPIMIAATAMAVATGIGAYGLHERHRAHVFEMYAFDTKGLPSYLIRTPDDRRILINGGANSDVIREITRILPFYSRHIDAVIATDDDPRNVTGLIDVLDRYEVAEIYLPSVTSSSIGLATSSGIHSTFLSSVRSGKFNVHEVGAGETISFESGVTAQALFPLPIEKLDYSRASPPQLILNISFGSTSMLLLGNASKKVQKAIATSSLGRSGVLLFSGPASPDNFSPELFNRVSPEYLIYSQAIRAQSTKKAPPKGKPAVSATASKKKSQIKKKLPSDPLMAIGDENRLNLKEKGRLRVTSNGEEMTIY